jgi:hypothetical protein
MGTINDDAPVLGLLLGNQTKAYEAIWLLVSKECASAFDSRPITPVVRGDCDNLRDGQAARTSRHDIDDHGCHLLLERHAVVVCTRVSIATMRRKLDSLNLNRSRWRGAGTAA